MTQTLCLKCMTRYLDIIPQQSPTLPRNCNIIMRASVKYARKYHARELKLKKSTQICQTPQAIRAIFACAKLQLVNTFNNSIIFFLYFCQRLCLRFVKCVSVTNILNLMHGTVSLARSLQIFNINAFSLLLKGELQSQLLTFVTNGNMFRISSETSFHQRAKFSSSA